MQEKPNESTTTAREIVCSHNDGASIENSWTGDFGLTRWIIFRHDGTGMVSFIDASEYRVRGVQ